MRTIFKTEFGSKVYGTAIATSDTDYKSVFIPSARDIILQRAPKVVTKNTKTNSTEKNTAADIDDESISLQQFLKLLAEGQTPMIDMLFAPAVHWEARSKVWLEILNHKERFLTKRLDAVCGYVATQANKYGVKGSRMAAIKVTIDMLSALPNKKSTLGDYQFLIEAFITEQKSEHVAKVMVDEKTKGIKPYLEVCGRKAPFNGRVDRALEMYQNVYDQYGHRAKLAEANEGIDWKALYHAVRVAREAEELLLTGNVTFPRPEAALLLDIRNGKLPYAQVAEIIEQGLENVKAAQLKSSLREVADYDFIDEFVLKYYRNECASLGWEAPPIPEDDY